MGLGPGHRPIAAGPGAPAVADFQGVRSGPVNSYRVRPTSRGFGWPVRTFEAAVPEGKLGLRWANFAYLSWLRLSAVDSRLLSRVVPEGLFYNALVTGVKPESAERLPG